MTIEKQHPRNTPSLEWLEQQIIVWIGDQGNTQVTLTNIRTLAQHLADNWLQVESLEVSPSEAP